MDSTILATSISPEQKDKQPKSVIKGFPEQFSSTRQESTNLVLLPFKIYDTNLNLFISYLNLILNYLMRIKKSVHWVSFCRI